MPLSAFYLKLFHPLAGADPAAITYLQSLLTNDNANLALIRQAARIYSRRRRNLIHPTYADDSEGEVGPFDSSETILIVGSWRSGTTLLHELMAADGLNYTCRTIDAIFPADPGRHLKHRHRLLNTMLPANRKFDLVRIMSNSAQEEEFALAQMAAPSVFLSCYFPSMRQEFLNEALNFEGLRPNARQIWSRCHLAMSHRLYTKYAAARRPELPPKRLILKNPANSTRIKTILKLYRNTKFIRILRTVDHVVPSITRMMNIATRQFSLERRFKPVDDSDSDAFVEILLERLDADWKSLPKGSRQTVDYEDLVRDPMSVIDQIYSRFGFALPPGRRDKIEKFWTTTASQWRRPQPPLS